METAESALSRKLPDVIEYEYVQAEHCPECEAEKGRVVLRNGLPYLLIADRLFAVVVEICACQRKWRWYQQDAMRKMGITDTEDLPPFLAARKAKSENGNG